MNPYELRHTPDGMMLCRLQNSGWQVLKDPQGGGVWNARGESGWWLYKGNEELARKEQSQRWAVIKKDMDSYYAQCWV